MTEKKYGVFSLPVIVAALGYFVDIYDLLLFTIVKKPSMLAVGATDATMLSDSTRVINWQMVGLLLGGILWGVLGDKKGQMPQIWMACLEKQLYLIRIYPHGAYKTSPLSLKISPLHLG